MTRLLRQAIPLAALLLLAGALGCGEARPRELADVKGKVTYKGKTLPGGMVVFQTADGYRGVGPIMPDGSYFLKCPPGPVKAAVVTRPPSPESMKEKAKRPAVREVHMPSGVHPSRLPPEKYDRFETSGLSYEVKPSGQTIDIPLAD